MVTFMSKLHRIVFYFTVLILFLIGRTKYKIVADGLGTPPESTGIIITNNHQRDCDVVLLTHVFLFSWRKWENIGSFSFTGRDDLFLPGYFPKFYPKLFVPIGILLFYLNLGPLLNYLNAYPMNKLGVRNLHELLVCIGSTAGDKPVDEVLAKGWEDKYPYLYNLYMKYRKRGKKLLISRCYRYCLLNDLREKASYEDAAEILYTSLKSNSVCAIKKSLNSFSDLLKNGNALYFPVEGELTCNGSFKTFRAGLGRIIEKCENISLLPINITYDFMQKGKTVVFLHFGKAIHIGSDINRYDLKQLVNSHITKLQTATMTSLLNLAITKIVKIEGRHEVSFNELQDITSQILDTYRRHNYYIDARLNSSEFHIYRLRKAIIWGKEMGLWDYFTNQGNLSLNINLEAFNAVRPGPWPDVNYISYAVNQLPQDILSEYLGSKYMMGSEYVMNNEYVISSEYMMGS